MIESAISVEGLSKEYRSGVLRRKISVAVKNLSFSVPQGRIVGLLGLNGAGKSTTLKSIFGLIFPTSGHISVLGHPAGDDALLNRIGIVSEIHPIFSALSASEQLRYFGKLSGLSNRDTEKRANVLLERFELGESKDQLASTFSKGMAQRLGFVQALLHDPELLLLDEPTTGLDPQGRQLIEEVIREQKESKKTILFSSHILPDIERLCDHVIILHKGCLAATCDVSTNSAANEWDVDFTGPPPTLSNEVFPESPQFRTDAGITKATRLSTHQKNALLEALAAAQSEVIRVQASRSSVEELFRTATLGALV